ncbi:MAG: hypothetical protein Q8R12_03775 [bacterium]|nr:hypothetical protein [bacterium]
MKTKFIWLLVLQILNPFTALGATCNPLTLEGHIAFVAPEGERLVVAWQSVRYLEIGSLSRAARKEKEYDRRIREAEERGARFITLYPVTRLEFLRREVWTPSFYGDKGRVVRKITFLERGCRNDREWVHTLLEPTELLFAPR